MNKIDSYKKLAHLPIEREWGVSSLDSERICIFEKAILNKVLKRNFSSIRWLTPTWNLASLLTNKVIKLIVEVFSMNNTSWETKILQNKHVIIKIFCIYNLSCLVDVKKIYQSQSTVQSSNLFHVIVKH